MNEIFAIDFEGESCFFSLTYLLSLVWSSSVFSSIIDHVEDDDDNHHKVKKKNDVRW